MISEACTVTICARLPCKTRSNSAALKLHTDGELLLFEGREGPPSPSGLKLALLRNS